MTKPDSKWWHLRLNALRVVTLFCPPVALLLLWVSPHPTRRERILGSIAVPLFSILYLSLVLWVLDLLFEVRFYEWRGGYLPSITLSPTATDHDAVESHRAKLRGKTTPIGFNISAGEQWPGFRGANRDGCYTAHSIRTNWPKTGLPLFWRQPVGGGYSSFAIAGDVAFTVEQRRNQEVATAYDVTTGRELWAHGWEAEFKEAIGGNGPRATPAYADGRVYALGGRGELRCFEAQTGALLWRHDIVGEVHCEELKYGVSASPLVVDDKVIVLSGGTNNCAVIAYHRATGEVLWHVLNDGGDYVSPMLVTLAGERQLLCVLAKRTVGLSIRDGKMLWDFAWGEPGQARNIAQPVVFDGDQFMLSAGYGVGCTAVKVEKTAAGFMARELWHNAWLKNKFSSSVFFNGCIYGLDEDILVCLDAATGQRRWKDGRYGYGQILLADGHLVILCGNGDLALVKASPHAHEPLARVPGIKGKTWNHPAIADGRLLVRNAVEMACFDISAR
jgi:outer membrane protein assembly factor BamB